MRRREMRLYRLFGIDAAGAVVAQLVDAVAYLHCRGVVHAGRLSRLSHFSISNLILAECDLRFSRGEHALPSPPFHRRSYSGPVV